MLSKVVIISLSLLALLISSCLCTDKGRHRESVIEVDRERASKQLLPEQICPSKQQSVQTTSLLPAGPMATQKETDELAQLLLTSADSTEEISPPAQDGPSDQQAATGDNAQSGAALVSNPLQHTVGGVGIRHQPKCRV